MNIQPVSEGEVEGNRVHHAITKVNAAWAKHRRLSALALVEDNENVTIVQWYIEKRACCLKAETTAFRISLSSNHNTIKLLNM